MIEQFLIFFIAKFFKGKDVGYSQSIKDVIRKIKPNVSELKKGDFYHYTSYGDELAKILNEKYDIKELSFDPEYQTKKHIIIRVMGSKGKKKNIIILFDSEKLCRSIIPSKMGKICGFNKNSNLMKDFNLSYDEICEKFYDRHDGRIFTKVSQKDVITELYLPINKLIVKTFNRKRKRAQKLFDFIMSSTNGTICVDGTHKRYKMYELILNNSDGSDDVFENPEGIYMKLDSDDPSAIIIHFNNGVKFKMAMKFNSHKVTKKIAVRYNISLIDSDQYLEEIAKGTI